jgi:2-polyprenyl-3-methyl-5-hydroxy-6-metoxy-1,4-benzoquinol methylase
MEMINCPVCHSAKYSTFLKTYDRFDPDKKIKFKLVRCRTCRFVFLNPRPDEAEIVQYYTSDDYDPFISLESSANIRSRLYTAIRHRNLAWKAKQILKVSTPGTLLDYGCATGEFIEQMNELGWQSYGLEVDQKARQFARDRDLNVVMNRNQLPGNIHYDVITLWHVLEHIHRLDDTLNFFSEKIAKSGYLIIAVPNLDSSDFKKYGHAWIALDAPRHLYHFNQRSIARLLQPYGFQLKQRIPLLFDTFYNHLMTNTIIHRVIPGITTALLGISSTLFQTLFISKNYASTLVYIFKKESTKTLPS